MNIKHLRAMCLGMLASCVLSAGVVQASSPVAVTDIHAPKFITVVKSPQRALFVGGSTTQGAGEDISTAMLNMGAEQVQVYKAQYKKGNDYRYGVIADVAIGSRGLSNMGVAPIGAGLIGKAFEKDATRAVKAVVQRINSGGIQDEGLWVMPLYPRKDGVLTGPYTIVSPLKETKKGIYTGTISIATEVKGVTYREQLHLVVYAHPYYGPSMRMIAVDAASDATVWPLLTKYQRVLS